MPRDLYDVLGVPPTASEAEIRHAFWTLAKRYHPDVNPGSADAARRFVEVGNAAETLLDTRRRASYDESRRPVAPARPPQAPKPPAPPGPAPAAGAPLPTAPEPASQLPDPGRWNTLKAVTVIAVIVVIVWWAQGHPSSSPSNQGGGMPTNGTVVWTSANFSLADGWGINLAGSGARIQLVPGVSTDIEYAGGYLASAGQIAQLPHGSASTYQHCVSAVQQAASQSESAGQIAPTVGSVLCASGSGGDLASILVIGADGSGVTVDITVWENV